MGEHHLALAVADHCSKLFPSMFPDSDIARGFKCGRTKATATVKVIAQDLIKEVLDKISDSKFFSIQIDESTDITFYQQMGIMLRFDNTNGKLGCMFYKLKSIKNADSESILAAIDQNFNETSPICYSILVGMGFDGCNVMLGSRNSVMTCIKTKQPYLVSFHCNCHVAALIANHACGKLQNIWAMSPFKSGIIFTKVLRGKDCLKATECKPHKVLKASQTRWVNLEACVNRLLEQYEALLSYFRSIDEESATVKWFTEALEKTYNKSISNVSW